MPEKQVSNVIKMVIMNDLFSIMGNTILIMKMIIIKITWKYEKNDVQEKKKNTNQYMQYYRIYTQEENNWRVYN